MTTPSTALGFTRGNTVQGMYYEFSVPLGLANLIEEVVTTNPGAPNQPIVSGGSTTNRQWFSQPRPGTDHTTEVITAIFKQPLSITQLGFQALRVSCEIEAWYQDPQNNWRQMLDGARQPVTLHLSTSSAGSWYTYTTQVYPIIAKAIQIRLTRVYDPVVGTAPYVVGLQQVLIRRDIYGRADGRMPLTDSQDALGNTITAYIKDWGAANAIDDNPHTYWRSAPQPDPAAVVNLYLDVRGPDGSPQLVDGIYLDPVYTGQTLNLYYTNDDTTGPLKLSPEALPPDFDENVDWVSGKGLQDASDFGGSCAYQFPMALGPLVSQNTWIGIEWAPDFAENLTNTVQTVAVSGAVGGTFALSYAGEATDPIPYDAAAATVAAALQDLPGIGAGGVSVAGGAGGPWVVTFTGIRGGQDIGPLGSDASGLRGWVTKVTVTVVAHGGQGGAPPTNPVLFGVTPGVDAEQTVSIAGTATGGTFTLSLEGAITTPLSYNASAADVGAALLALPGIGATDIKVVGDAGGPWAVTFQGALGQQPIPTMTAGSALTGSVPAPTVVVEATVTGITPANPGQQWWPTVYYDGGAGAITLELWNGDVGTVAQTYSAALTKAFIPYQPLRIAVGWSYASSGVVDADTVTIMVATQSGAVVGSLTATPDDLPTQITLDGEVGFTNFRGTLSATIVKLEDATANRAAFLANPTMYCFPAPVIPNPDGTIPSTTLDNAVYAAAWTLQDLATGGGDGSAYENKTWTPIWSNYTTQKGKLFLPQSISMKYLKCEFSGLTEEPYPVYDTGISVSYVVFPVSVTAQATMQRNCHPGLLGATAGLLSMGSGALQGLGGGCVNWLNPSTVARAVSATFTPVSQTVQVTVGPGYVTGSLPGAAQTEITATARTEASSPWVYRRPMPDATTLANQALNALTGTAVIQNVSSALDPVSGALTTSFTTGRPGVPTSTPPSLPVQGNDWWVFPGGTLKMPAHVMNGVCGRTHVVCHRKHTTEVRYRFTTTCIHRYDVKTVTHDAAVAYFAGVREVQALITSYIDQQDPISFVFSSYDPTQWVLHNTRALTTGPISTAGKIFSVDNADFDLGLGDWTADSGDWGWDGSQFGGYMYPGAATIDANGERAVLLSAEIVAVGATQDLTAGDSIDLSVAVRWSNLVTPGSEAPIQLAVVELTDGEVTGTTVVASIGGAPEGEMILEDTGPPMVFGDTAPDPDPPLAVSGRGALTAAARMYQITSTVATSGRGRPTASLTIKPGTPYHQSLPGRPGGRGALTATARMYQIRQPGVFGGTGRLTATAWRKVTTPAALGGQGALAGSAAASQFRISARLSGRGALAGPTVAPVFAGFGALTVTVGTTSISEMNDYTVISGTWTAPTGCNGARIAFIVTEDATEGTVAFDFLRMDPGGEILATTYKHLTTMSTFAKITAKFNDSGLVRSDSMWARLDPTDTNISSGALAYYADTIPDIIPPGTWGDTFATWADPNTAWGEPRAVVAIDVDPNRIYQGQRVLHFHRAAGVGEAGVKVRQWTNWVPNGLARICAVWLKPQSDDNQVTLRLRRMFDGVYIYEQDVTPAVGYWEQVTGNWFEIPDSKNQVYTVELVLTGDDADELYLSDLYVEIAHARYFLQLGGVEEFMHDVTALAYSPQATAIVSCTDAVNEMSIQSAILSPKVWEYGCTITPQYLK